MIDAAQFEREIQNTFTTPCVMEEVQSEDSSHIGYAVFYKGQENEVKLPISYLSNPQFRDVWGIGYSFHRNTLAAAAAAMQEFKREQYIRIATEIGVLTTQRGKSLSVEKFVAEIRAALPLLEDIRFDEFNRGGVDFLVASVILSSDENEEPLEVSCDGYGWSIECDIGDGCINGDSFAEVLGVYANKMLDQIDHYDQAHQRLRNAGCV